MDLIKAGGVCMPSGGWLRAKMTEQCILGEEAGGLDMVHEIALAALTDELYCEKDGGSVTVLIRLDFSAVFDAIEYSTLLARHCGLGAGGAVSQWFCSDLHSCYQRVSAAGSSSSRNLAECSRSSALISALIPYRKRPLGKSICSENHGGKVAKFGAVYAVLSCCMQGRIMGNRSTSVRKG